MDGNELLEYKKHPDYKNKKVAVIGGGNVAMDCCRTIKKLGANEVIVIYRRSEEQMPADKKEIANAKDEGIKFLFQNNVVKIVGNQKVERIELIKTELIKKQGENRLVPQNIKNSNYEIDIDYVIMALGSEPEKFVNKLNIDLDNDMNIKINEEFKTSLKNVYAAGDIAGIRKTVAWAAKSGRDAAESIIKNI